MNKFFFITLTVLVLILNIFLCIISFNFDNKYTYKRHPSKYGITTLNIKSYDKSPLFFLIDGWEFYQYKWLTPDDFNKNIYTPDDYIFIGKYGGFEMNDPNKNPHGVATYRLNIFTDSKERLYALEISEIFSQWSIWINGELMASDNYDDQNNYFQAGNIITFNAKEKIEIIISVKDNDGFFSGIITPPAFGSPKEVNRILILRTIVHGMGVTTALIIALICAFLGIIYNKKIYYGLLLLLCFSFIGFTFYPIAFSIGIKHSNFITIERFCYYNMFTIIILLQGIICNISKKIYLSFSLLAFITSISTLLMPYFNFETALPLYKFSRFLINFILFVSIYILFINIWALLKKKPYSKILTIGFVIFGSSLIMDRIYTTFEPIIFGWFPELSGFILIVLIFIILWVDTFLVVKDGEKLKEEIKNNEVAYTIQKEEAYKQQMYLDYSNEIIHEIKNRLVLIKFYIEYNKNEKLKQYINSLLEEDFNKKFINYTENPIVNAILNKELKNAEEKEIYVENEFKNITFSIPFNDSDIVSVLMNILENAIEYCEKLESIEDRWIYFSLEFDKNILIIKCKNSYYNKKKFTNSVFYTTKTDKIYHGYGLKIIKKIAEKYNGDLILSEFDDYFSLTVIIKSNIE